MSRIYAIEPHQRVLLLTEQTLTDPSWHVLLFRKVARAQIAQTSLCAAFQWGLYWARLMMYYLVRPLPWLNTNKWCVEITATYLTAILNVNILALYLPVKVIIYEGQPLKQPCMNWLTYSTQDPLTRVTPATHAKRTQHSKPTAGFISIGWHLRVANMNETEGTPPANLLLVNYGNLPSCFNGFVIALPFVSKSKTGICSIGTFPSLQGHRRLMTVTFTAHKACLDPLLQLARLSP
jgi:hypothetical protein